jgi:mRNA interferase MazF
MRAAPVALVEPLRGEVWDVRFPAFGEHPAVVVSVNPLNARLGHVAVIPVTGSPGPPSTHVTLTPDAGLTRYDESYADVTSCQPLARSRFRRRRGLLGSGELGHVEQQLRVYLGL